MQRGEKEKRKDKKTRAAHKTPQGEKRERKRVGGIHQRQEAEGDEEEEEEAAAAVMGEQQQSGKGRRREEEEEG